MRAILTYHSIDESGSPISITASSFRAHIRFLSSGHVPIVPLRDLVRRTDGGNAVSLTFDDGFANFESVAMPLLHELGLAATVFVVPDYVGRNNSWDPAGHSIPRLPLMGWDGLGRALGQGIEIGAHSRRHRDLVGLSKDDLADEVGGSRERIAASLGTRPTTFAYPFGRFDAGARACAGENFAYACTTELRLLTPRDDRLLLPRLDMYYFRERGQLEAWGTAAFRTRVWVRAQGRRLRRLMARAGATS